MKNKIDECNDKNQLFESLIQLSKSLSVENVSSSTFEQVTKLFNSMMARYQKLNRDNIGDYLYDKVRIYNHSYHFMS
jgi:hypothetical protein